MNGSMKTTTTKKRHKDITHAGRLRRLLTRLTVKAGVAWFAATGVGRRALHVPTAGVPAHSWENGRQILFRGNCVLQAKLTPPNVQLLL